jgi:hypothetical protein
MNFIQRKAPSAFVDGVKGQQLKQHFLTGSNTSLNETLNQALKLEVTMEEAGSPAKLREVATAPMEMQPPSAQHHRNGIQLYAYGLRRHAQHI